MDKKILVISGMPASGKDTVTEILCDGNKKIIELKKHRSITKEVNVKE